MDKERVMRHIVHDILARYLGSEQHAFEASARELWPQSAARHARPIGEDEPGGGHDVYYGELEPQN
jgi:hypothetical protein